MKGSQDTFGHADEILKKSSGQGGASDSPAEKFANDGAMDIGESEIAAAVAVG